MPGRVAIVRVVAGPPCSGKSTYIAEHASPDAVVLDVDALARALGYPAEHIDWSDPTVHPARSAAMIARASLLKRAGSLGEVWVTSTSRAEAVAGAEVVVLDPGMDECLARARRDGRPAATGDQIRRWYGDELVGATSEAW